jgi:hypothetical protein
MFRQNISARSRGVSGRKAVRVRSLQAGGFEEGLPRYTPEQPEKDLSKLEVGSIVVVTEMPEFVKTSNAMAALRIAKDVISLGDPGRYSGMLGNMTQSRKRFCIVSPSLNVMSREVGTVYVLIETFTDVSLQNWTIHQGEGFRTA